VEAVDVVETKGDADHDDDGEQLHVAVLRRA
jgi:hypothetical protein